MTIPISPLTLALTMQDKGMLEALGAIESQQTERNAWLLRAGEQAKRLNAESKHDFNSSTAAGGVSASPAGGSR